MITATTQLWPTSTQSRSQWSSLLHVLTVQHILHTYDTHDNTLAAAAEHGATITYTTRSNPSMT